MIAVVYADARRIYIYINVITMNDKDEDNEEEKRNAVEELKKKKKKRKITKPKTTPRKLKSQGDIEYEESRRLDHSRNKKTTRTNGMSEYNIL